MRSIVETRGVLDDQLTATLHQDVQNSLARLYRTARKQADLALREHGESEAAAALPTECTYTLEQILAEDWYPEPPAGPEPG